SSKQRSACKGSISKIQTPDFRNEHLTLRTLTALIRTLIRTAPQSNVLHVRDPFQKSKPRISEMNTLHSER
ncbi:hypothetical protein, partial [Lentilactobacillus hilgardii]|uniref:hypothetical protein n=1 Tax=Lentilactobacillus hilgardii TaxID=1588 RepID=UPI00390C7FFD